MTCLIQIAAIRKRELPNAALNGSDAVVDEDRDVNDCVVVDESSADDLADDVGRGPICDDAAAVLWRRVGVQQANWLPDKLGDDSLEFIAIAKFLANRSVAVPIAKSVATKVNARCASLKHARVNRRGKRGEAIVSNFLEHCPGYDPGTVLANLRPVSLENVQGSQEVLPGELHRTFLRVVVTVTSDPGRIML
jgi:hypothetical protein